MFINTGVIFCAGLGQRMGYLTQSCPKALLSLQGQTMLEWQIMDLQAAGVKEFFINTHYLSEQLHDFIKKFVLSGDESLKMVHQMVASGKIYRNIMKNKFSKT